MILHLVAKAEWDAKPIDQPYVPDAFAKDGFIHCTQGDALLLQVANNIYKSTSGEFLALSIDESKVKSEIKWEAPSSPIPGPAPSPTPSLPTPAPATPSAPAQHPIEPPPEAKAEYGSALENTDAAAASGSASPPHPVTSSPLPPVSPSTKFPHIYGPLNRDAIVQVRRLVRAADGTFTGYAALDTAPAGMRLKSPSELANELVNATGDFSEALARYKDRVEAHMDELDKNIKDKLS